MDALIGNGFAQPIYDQINIRQKYLGLTKSTTLSSFNNSNINPNDILLLNHGGTAWLRLASSVNIDGNNNLASSKVLFGGTADYTFINFPEGGNVLSRQGLKDYDNWGDAMGTTPNANTGFGFRPPATLLGADISYLNDNGTLKKATIKIKAFSPKQLDDIDKLYMRVGYSILLEWGHSIYIDNNGIIVKNPSITSTTFNKFIIGNKITPEDIYKSIEEDQNKFNGNYEGFFGIISKFNWSFNPSDATYDITIDAITQGQIVESLKINKAISKQVEDDCNKNPDPTNNNEATSTIVINKNASLLNNFIYNTYTKMLTTVGTTRVDTIIPDNYNESVNVAKAAITVEHNQVFEQPCESNDNKYNQFYVSFSSLLNIIDKYQNIEIEETTNGKKYLEIKTDAYYNRYSKTISSDPRKVLVGNSKISPGCITGLSETRSIKHIYLNLIYLSNLLSELKSNDGEIDLDSFLKQILNDINYCLGNVCNLTYRINNNILEVYDERPLRGDSASPTPKGPVPEFNIYGVTEAMGSFVKNINFNVTITNEMSTMITIGAQADGNQPSYNAVSFSNFNRNLIDRIIPRKITSTNAGTNNLNITKRRDEIITQIYQGTSSTDSSEDGVLGAAAIVNDELINEFSNLNVEILKQYAGTRDKEGIFFLPFDLSLTMKGLGGMRIFDRFSLTKFSDTILPSTYRSNNSGNSIIDYILFDIKHSIQNNKWETTIRGKTVPTIKKITESPNTGSATTGSAVTGSAETGSGTIPTGDEADFWTLLSICALEDGDNQGRADVAQSIYNRLYAATKKGAGYGKPKTLKGLITTQNQYEPVFGKSNGEVGTGPGSKWIAIKDKNTAIAALNGHNRRKTLTTQQIFQELKQVYNALRNPTLQQASKEFIQGRTDFLSITQGTVEQRNQKKRAGPFDPSGKRGTFVMRISGTPNNVFGWAYNYTSNIIAEPPSQDWWNKFASQFE